MKVYLVTDLEGVSGVSGFDVRDSTHPQDIELRRLWSNLWIAEVNAAVAGAVSAGANQILVIDNHGPGNTLPAESLASPAQLVHGGRRTSWLEGLDDTFDALLIIGQHAMAGAPLGHLRHTYSRRRLEQVTLRETRGDGEKNEIGEIGLVVGIAGEFGVPVVFLSGDLAATAEIEALVPHVTSASVKRGLSKEACVSLAPVDSCDLIRSGVERALRQPERVEPRRFVPPLELRMRYGRRHGWRAAARGLLPGAGVSWRPPRELRVEGDTLRQVWDRAIGLAR